MENVLFKKKKKKSFSMNAGSSAIRELVIFLVVISILNYIYSFLLQTTHLNIFGPKVNKKLL